MLGLRVSPPRSGCPSTSERGSTASPRWKRGCAWRSRAVRATTIRADGDQLDQLLINIVRNGVDAALETRGGVRIGWSTQHGMLSVTIEDDGPGIASSANLFVPFFTTKPQGSGIGLVLSRQIAEGHGGSLSIENRAEGVGCIATLRLAVQESQA